MELFRRARRPKRRKTKSEEKFCILCVLFEKMNKLNEVTAISSTPDVLILEKNDEISLGNEEEREKHSSDNGTDGTTCRKMESDILKFTMLFNKYSCVLDTKRRDDSRDNKYAMFFNKEVTIRRSPEAVSSAAKILEAKKSGFFNPRRNQPLRSNRAKSKFHPHSFSPSSQEPQLSEPGMMFCTSLFSSLPDVCDNKFQWKTEPGKKLSNRRSLRAEIADVFGLPGDLRNHNSLTNLPMCNRGGAKGELRSKISSLTALDASSDLAKNDPSSRFGYWDHWDDLTLMQNDVEKRLNLQISRSTNDSSRRSVVKLKKEDAASVSDSKLLYADYESRKHIKKCDKKSRGDSYRKETSSGTRKQVQWKTEVDVIYFSIQSAANGDKTGEVIGRVMEPLREEWEQQRKGFYAKVVPSHMENHVKDHFISLLKI